MDDFELLTASFDGHVVAANDESLATFGVSKASIEEKTRHLFPEDFDTKKNVDILPVVFNLAVVNKFNKNGDGMDAKTAVAAVKSFINKPINVEHKKDQIVGHILNASFSYAENDFKDNDIESFVSEDKPFYITAAGVIYRHIFPQLANAILAASDEDNEEYKSISTSWEIGFKKFKIAKGSELISEASIVTGKEEMAAAKKYHKAFGGKGVDKEGNLIGRVIVGEVLPLGAGLTYVPAAEVEGVFVVGGDEEEEKDKENLEINNKNKKVLKNNSLIAKNIVRIEKLRNFLNMDEKQFNAFISKLETSIASITSEESQASSIGVVMKDTLTEFSKTWETKVNAEKQEAETAKTQLKELNESFANIQKELDSLKTEAATKAAADLFNARMNFLEENYEFAEAETSLVVNDLKTVEASDEAFDKFKDKLSILFAHKSKASIASQKEAIDQKVEEEVAKRLQTATASTTATETSAEEVVEAAEAEVSASVPNGTEGTSKKESLIETLKKNFSVEVTM